MRSEESVEIDRLPEEVFSYVANPENLPEWTNMVLEVRKDAEGQLKVGDRFSVVAKFLGRRFETPFEVSAHEPPRQHSDTSTGGPFEQEFIYTFEQTGEGKTRLTQVVETEPGLPSSPSWARKRTPCKRGMVERVATARATLPRRSASWPAVVVIFMGFFLSSQAAVVRKKKAVVPDPSRGSGWGMTLLPGGPPLAPVGRRPARVRMAAPQSALARRVGTEIRAARGWTGAFRSGRAL